MRIAFYDSETDSTAKLVDVSWNDLVEDLTRASESEKPCTGTKDCPNKYGPCWAPTAVTVPVRGDKPVTHVDALVLDLDSCTLTPDEISARLDGLSHILHSTHSHSAGVRTAYRVIVALSEPVPAHQWSRFWSKAVARFGLPVDPTCKNPGHIYFFPRVCTPVKVPFIGYARDGKPLDVVSILSAAPVATLAAGLEPLPTPAPAALSMTEAIDVDEIRAAIKNLRKPETRAMLMRLVDHQPMATVGSRDDTINRTMSALAGITPRPDLAALTTLVYPSIHRMETQPEGEQHWVDKAVHSYERACVRMDALRAKEDETRSTMLALAGKASHPLVAPGEWRDKLVANPQTGRFKANEANASAILENEPAWFGSLRFNEVTKSIDVTGGPLAGEVSSSLNIAAACWLQRSEYKLDVSSQTMGPVLLHVAKKNAYDPLKTYLERLDWDETPRLDMYLAQYCKENEFTKVFARKWAIGAVARALQPGCKMDNALILVGDYGTRKTGFVETMAGDFFSNGKIDFGSKDSRMLAARYWIVEMAEMGSYKRADSNAVKDWLSTRVDSYRLPYAAAVEDFPRRAVFVGTSNDVEMFQEPNRREWVVEVNEIDIGWLKDNRDQIWAEAVTRYKGGETWWLDKDLEHRATREHTANFSAPVSYAEPLQEWWDSLPYDKKPESITMTQACSVLGITPDKHTSHLQRDVSWALKSMGFLRQRPQAGGGTRKWVYTAPKRPL